MISEHTRSLVLGPRKARSDRALKCVDGRVSAHLALARSLINGCGSHGEVGGGDEDEDEGAVNKEVLAGRIETKAQLVMPGAVAEEKYCQ